MPGKGKGGSRHTMGQPQGPPRECTESLLATAEEKLATSKSLYGDHKARISANVHHIHDAQRIAAYQLPMAQCMRGKTVLHLGCGMGLLSMMAARAMAKHVVAVDSSSIVESAAVVAEQNKLTNLTFLRGSVREGLKLPFEKFDVILCEWMGNLVCNETETLRELLHCRRHHLAEGGEVCPNEGVLRVAGLMDYQYKCDTVDYWENVYGFKMLPMQPLVRKEPTASSIPLHMFRTPLVEVARVTLDQLAAQADEELTPAKLGLKGKFELPVHGKGTLHYLTYFVDAAFRSASTPAANFVLGSKPGHPNPWTEVSALLPEALPGFAGDVVSGEVSVTPAGQGVDLEMSVKCANDIVQHDSTCTQHYQY